MNSKNKDLKERFKNKNKKLKKDLKRYLMNMNIDSQNKRYNLKKNLLLTKIT